MTSVPAGNFVAAMACAANRPNAMPTWTALPTDSAEAEFASIPAKGPKTVIMVPFVGPTGAASKITRTHASMQRIVSLVRSAATVAALRAVTLTIHVPSDRPVMRAVYAKTIRRSVWRTGIATRRSIVVTDAVTTHV